MVRAAYIRFYMTVTRIHRHEAGTQEELIITYGIHRSHYSIFLTAPTEYRHLFGRIERFPDFRFGSSGSLHDAVAVGQSHGTVQNFVYLFLRQTESIRRFLRTFLLFEEVALQFFQMLGHGILCIFLHAGVYCSIDFQPVRIKIIFASVLLCILFAPAEQRVCFPVERILVILLHLPAAIVRFIGLLGIQHTTQVFTEIRCKTFVMVYAMIGQLQWQCLQRIPFLNGDISGLAHLVEHHIAASARTFVITYRIIKGRILAHTHQCGGFLYLQILRFATEIGIGGSLYTHRIIQEVELIEIHRKNFLFGIIAFQLHGYNPLDGLLEQTFHYVVGAWRIKLLGKLLADCTAAARILLHQNTTLHHGTEQRDGINPRMFGKAYVFRCNQRIDNMGRQIIVSHKHAVLLAIRISSQNFPVF